VFGPTVASGATARKIGVASFFHGHGAENWCRLIFARTWRKIGVASLFHLHGEKLVSLHFSTDTNNADVALRFILVIGGSLRVRARIRLGDRFDFPTENDAYRIWSQVWASMPLNWFKCVRLVVAMVTVSPG
jgi:hypothetical protein